MKVIFPIKEDIAPMVEKRYVPFDGSSRTWGKPFIFPSCDHRIPKTAANDRQPLSSYSLLWF